MAAFGSKLVFLRWGLSGGNRLRLIYHEPLLTTVDWLSSIHSLHGRLVGLAGSNFHVNHGMFARSSDV